MEKDGRRAAWVAGAIAVKVCSTQTQLPLSLEIVPDKTERQYPVSQVRWSYSRRTVLEQCPRRYYYEYYGTAALAASGDPNGVVLRVLKSLQNRHERAGMIAHLVISTYLRKARSGEVWMTDRLSRWARDIFQKDCAYSRANPVGSSRQAERFPPVLLHEYYYRYPDASQLCLDAQERLVHAVHTFATSPHFAEFRLAGEKPDSFIEHRLTLGGLPCQVDGKLDLAFAAEGRGVIVDWKLGEPSGSGEDSLQLAIYALWASQHFAVGSEAISVYKAYLATGEIVQFPVSDRVLVNCRARITQDVERMAVLHDYGERGVAEAFTPCAQRAVCKLCPFQELCPEGSAVLHD